MSSTKELIARLKALDLDLTDLKGDEWAAAADAAMLDAVAYLTEMDAEIAMLRRANIRGVSPLDQQLEEFSASVEDFRAEIARAALERQP